MRNVARALCYAWWSRRAWWFTATARTRERFARTTLGSFWLGLSNLLSIAALATVYGTVFKVQDYRVYVVYLGTGLVIWNTIAAAIQAAPNILRANAGSIKNTNIQPIFYTLEEWSFQVQTFFQSFGLVIACLSIFQPSLIPNFLIAGLLPVLNLVLFIYWLPLLLCVVGAKYEDLFQLIPIVLQLMFLLSPILYKKEALGAFAWTATWNPLYRVLNSLRQALIQGDLKIEQSISIFLINLAGIGISIWALERQRRELPFII
jgi:lipopolysaccharide transport system permease protein